LPESLKWGIMKGYYFKVFLFAALFVALCVKAGQISSAEGVMAMTRLVQPEVSTPVDNNTPQRPEEDFRGLSPRPDLSQRLTPAKREIRHDARQVPGKSSTSQSLKEAARRAAKKG